MDETLAAGIADSALAFRGYNITNLGRSAELLAVGPYQSLVEEELTRYAEVCSDVVGRRVDLVDLVRRGAEPELEHYAEALATVVAIGAA